MEPAPVHVSLKGVTRVYPTKTGGLQALGPVDLDLRKGEFFAVVGPSGCGKSTLLEMIAALRQKVTPEMVVQEINRYADSEWRYSDSADEAAIEEAVRGMERMEEARKRFGVRG